MVADELRSRCEAKKAKEDGNSVRRSPEADEEGSPDGQQEGKRPAGDAGWEEQGQSLSSNGGVAEAVAEVLCVALEFASSHDTQ
jgi:hypothetical protein